MSQSLKLGENADFGHIYAVREKHLAEVYLGRIKCDKSCECCEVHKNITEGRKIRNQTEFEVHIRGLSGDDYFIKCDANSYVF